MYFNKVMVLLMGAPINNTITLLKFVTSHKTSRSITQHTQLNLFETHLKITRFESKDFYYIERAYRNFWNIFTILNFYKI
jgi:hypothetical protein